MDYPIWDFALGGGMLMALVAVPHVIVAHFAVGGGLLIAVTETLGVRRNDPELRELAKRSSLILILVSTVYGAISGVGIWVVAGLISPGAISSLIHNYVWGWAIEWVFFILEIVAALVYYTTWGKISKKAHMLVGWLYFVGAYGSLLVINGIITYQLTPGGWLESHAFWDGFFNPTYWPATLLRTGIALMMAAAFMIFAASKSSTAATRLVRYIGLWFVAGSLISYVGYRWWETQLGETTRALFLGDSPTLATLATTRSFTLWALAVALVLGILFLVIAPRTVKLIVPGVLVMVAAFAFFAGYERLREGSRKPFLIHSHLFANGLLVEDIERINSEGLQAYSGWVSIGGSDDQAEIGRRIFKIECSACHTLNGYQSITGVLPTFAEMLAVAANDPSGSGATAYEASCASCHGDISFEEMAEVLPTPEEMQEDPEMITDLLDGMITGTLFELRDMGQAYVDADPTVQFDTQTTAYPMMPPFVGNDEDLEALAAYLSTLTHGIGKPTELMGGGE